MSKQRKWVIRSLVLAVVLGLALGACLDSAGRARNEKGDVQMEAPASPDPAPPAREDDDEEEED